jgi:hypothetical protein
LPLVEPTNQVGRQVDIAIAPIGVVEPGPDDPVSGRGGRI